MAALHRNAEDFRLGVPRSQLEKAVPLLEDVLNARKAKLGLEDPQTLNSMGMLGVTYKDMGRHKEAIAVLEPGAAKDEWVRQHLLDVYAIVGEHAKIVTLSLEHLKPLRKLKDEGEVTNAKVDLLARLGKAYLAQMKWSDAEPHLRERVATREKNSPDHWTTFETQSLLGRSLLLQKKYAEAEPLLIKSYEELKQTENSLEPKDLHCIPEAIDRLIELYTLTNKPDEAKKWRTEREKYPAQLKKGPMPREVR